ncbi:MAG: glycosyltransferase family 4 protein [Rhodobacteraceae bacterium]|nr:glycosyltransferase family 4 protein [Paracoccaceae bacterium]
MKNVGYRPSIMLIGGEDIHFRLPFMRILREHGFDVIAVGSVPQPILEQEGFAYHLYPLERSLAPIKDLFALRSLRRIIAKVQPDIVHAFDTKPGFLVPLSMIGLKGPKAMRTITGMGAIFSENTARNRILRRIYRALHRLAGRRVDFTIFQNTADRQFFTQFGLVREGEHSLIRGSGVSIPDWGGQAADIRAKMRKSLGLGANDFVFLMVARLVRQKGVADALTAAKTVLADHKNARFIFVGPTGENEPDGVQLEDFDDENGQIMYLGRRSDVAHLLVACDTFVLPTKYREGVPRAMLEALATQRPAIVSDMPGCADPALEARAGWVVPAGDVAALTTAMFEAINSEKDELARMGQRGKQEISRNYELAFVIAQTLDIYSMFLTSKNQREVA